MDRCRVDPRLLGLQSLGETLTAGIGGKVDLRAHEGRLAYSAASATGAGM